MTRRHQPHRPAWTCDTCPDAVPWPCEPARAEFLAYYGGPRMMLFFELGDYWQAAIDDHFATMGSLPDGLYDQIMLWPRAFFPRPAG